MQENPFPFPHPEINISDFSAFSQSIFNDQKYQNCCNFGYSVLEVSDCSHKPLLDQINVKEEDIPKWRCFIKGCSSSHVILTIIPASFSDLKKLYPHTFNSDVLASNSEASKLTESQTENESNLAENTEDDTKISTNSKNRDSGSVTESSVQENVDEMNSTIDLLYIPLYVYSGVLSSITNQLVYSFESDAIKDTYVKYTFEYENCVDEQSNISGTQSVTLSQYNEETEKQYKRPKKDSHYFKLREHCSLIEKSYSKAFVYSVYRYVDFSIF